MAFTDFPEQWELYKKERPSQRRTRSSAGPPGHVVPADRLEDYELSGVQIKKASGRHGLRSATSTRGVDDRSPSTSCVIPTRSGIWWHRRALLRRANWRA